MNRSAVAAENSGRELNVAIVGAAKANELAGSSRFVLILNFLISSRPLSTASKSSSFPSVVTTGLLARLT